MNLPNFFTVLRILLTALFLCLIFREGIGFRVASLVVFSGAAFTDYWDGRLARRSGKITAFGKLMDPIADKILVFGVFFAFVYLEIVPLWLVLVMLTREVLITGLRILAVKRGVVLPALNSGKLKTILQLLSLEAILVLLIVREIFGDSAQLDGAFWMVRGLLYVVLVLTLYSGVRFIGANRKILIRHA